MDKCKKMHETMWTGLEEVFLFFHFLIKFAYQTKNMDDPIGYTLHLEGLNQVSHVMLCLISCRTNLIYIFFPQDTSSL